MNVQRADTRRFRAEREDEWRRLEAIIERAEKSSPKRLSDEELLALPVLYRNALSSLSVARETSLDLELLNYLESLCARAYFYVYGVRTSIGQRAADFFETEWPACVRALWRETLASAFLFAAGCLAGFLLVNQDSSWYSGIMPGEMAGGRDFTATSDQLRATLYDSGGKTGLAVFATFLFSHNSQVSILAFALGFAFGVPTMMLILYNGATLGAFLALFAARGLGWESGGWLAIHGTTEIFAMVLAGAAGLKIGWSVVFPGEESRLDAAALSGRTAGLVMGGVVLMLLVAGLLEGFGRQLITSDIARYTIGSGMLLLWMLYFYLPRARPA